MLLKDRTLDGVRKGHDSYLQSCFVAFSALTGNVDALDDQSWAMATI
jgi:hypothetical protein